MVKKRKGRVLIDSDTEDSGSEENLDQVRGQARPERGAWDRRPALGSAPPSLPGSRPVVPRRSRPPQPDGAPRPPWGEPAPLWRVPALPWQEARVGGGSLQRPGARRRRD